MRRTSITATLSLVAVLAVTVAAQPVGATYPGTIDGRLAFGMPLGNFATTDIYSITPEGKGLHRLTDSPDFEACPAYSPNGKEITYCRGVAAAGGVVEIWSMKQNGNKQRQVTHHGGRSTFPDFSPDGQRIAFQSAVPSTATFDIYVVNSDGTGLVQLTNDPAQDSLPVWSPDRQKIAFVSRRTGVDQVWVMDADGDNPTQLTFDLAPKGQLPDWSPDGTKIAYQSLATGAGDIYVMNADGSNQTRLTTDPALDFGPTWSPTGTRIAFLSARNGPNRELFVMNIDGTGQTLIHPGDHAVPGWQPLDDQP